MEHSLSKLIVLPRISFTGNGKTDSVTCGWFIWIKDDSIKKLIDKPFVTVPKLKDEPKY
jgi:hypothetical protein